MQMIEKNKKQIVNFFLITGVIISSTGIALIAISSLIDIGFTFIKRYFIEPYVRVEIRREI